MKVEASDLTDLWHEFARKSPIILTGAGATKQALRAQAANSDIIHFATHAIELDQACMQSSTTRGIELTALPSTPLSPHATPGAALALTGANNFLGPLHDASGIVSAQEAVTLPLDHTQWVVLSACDTGLGEVINGEGIFGLRRAFRIAGAKTVLMSLWKVEDKATAEWMKIL